MGVRGIGRGYKMEESKEVDRGEEGEPETVLFIPSTPGGEL